MMWSMVEFCAGLGLGLSIIALFGAGVVGVIAYGAKCVERAIERIDR